MANDSDIISYITKNRSFIDYVREIKRVSGLDIRDIVIEAALEKDRANFFDLGCGYGYASLDFFNVLEERCLQKRVNPDILQNVNYYGFDLFVKPVENKDRRTHFAYPKDICDSFEGFPAADIAVSFFSFPYLDDKLGALNSWYTSLNNNGKIITTHYYPHQIEAHGLKLSEKVNFDLTEIFPATIKKGSDPLLLITRKNPPGHLPKFLASEMENTHWWRGTPKGFHAGQKISHYLID